MVDRADDAPQSAIHAPPTFKAFDKSQPPVKEGSEDTVVSPATPETAPRIEEKVGQIEMSNALRMLTGLVARHCSITGEHRRPTLSRPNHAASTYSSRD